LDQGVAKLVDRARLFLHADDDPAGREIVAALHQSLPGAEPWCPPARRASRPTTSRYEEQELDDLLADLLADLA